MLEAITIALTHQFLDMKKVFQTIIYGLGLMTLIALLIGAFAGCEGQVDGSAKPAILELEAPSYLSDLWPNQSLVLEKKKGFIGRFFDGYKIKGWKVAAWSGMAIAGSLWGAREAYHADGGVFERKWNVDPYSFLGSRAWERNYEGNRYRNSDGSVNPLKRPEWLNPTRDYWHASGAAAPIMVVSFGFTIGASDQPLKFKVVDGLGGMAIGLAASKLTYAYLR